MSKKRVMVYAVSGWRYDCDPDEKRPLVEGYTLGVYPTLEDAKSAMLTDVYGTRHQFMDNVMVDVCDNQTANMAHELRVYDRRHGVITHREEWHIAAEFVEVDA